MILVYKMGQTKLIFLLQYKECHINSKLIILISLSSHLYKKIDLRTNLSSFTFFVEVIFYFSKLYINFYTKRKLDIYFIQEKSVFGLIATTTFIHFNVGK